MANACEQIMRVMLVVIGFCAVAIAQESGTSPTTLADIGRQAEVARQAGRKGDATRLYERGVEVDPAWAEGWWQLARLSYDVGKYVDAEEALRHFTRIKADSGPAYGLMGLCLYQRGEFDAALENLQYGQNFGLGEDTTLSRPVRYHIALVMIRKGLFGSALVTLKSFAEDRDDNEDVLLAMGLAMLRVPVAPEELNPAKEDLVLRSGRAAFLAAEHRYVEADREYRTLLAAYPDTLNVHYDYGIYLYLSTDYEHAIDVFKAELNLFPNNAPATTYLALTCLKINRFAEALRYAKRAVALDPAPYAAQYVLGQSLVKTGDFNGGIEHLEAAQKLGPDNSEVHYALFRAYVGAGRKTDAERELAIFQELKKKSLAEEPKGVTFAHRVGASEIEGFN